PGRPVAAFATGPATVEIQPQAAAVPVVLRMHFAPARAKPWQSWSLRIGRHETGLSRPQCAQPLLLLQAGENRLFPPRYVRQTFHLQRAEKTGGMRPWAREATSQTERPSEATRSIL